MTHLISIGVSVLRRVVVSDRVEVRGQEGIVLGVVDTRANILIVDWNVRGRNDPNQDCPVVKLNKTMSNEG